MDLNQSWYMGALASPESFGHTGFTGRSVVVNTASRTIVVLLSNAVHPDRYWSTKTAYRNVARRTISDDVAEAVLTD